MDLFPIKFDPTGVKSAGGVIAIVALGLVLNVVLVAIMAGAIAFGAGVGWEFAT